MCLVISVLLAALSFNFYLNGFYIQTAVMAVFSLGFIVLMVRNVGCNKGMCLIKKDTFQEDKVLNLNNKEPAMFNEKESENK